MRRRKQRRWRKQQRNRADVVNSVRSIFRAVRAPETPRHRRRALRVEPLENRIVLTTFTVTNTGDSGAGSLREAIDSANAVSGADVIEFNIPGSGVQTIAPTTAMPYVTDELTIDGTSQPGYAGTPLIELSGAAVAGYSDGLVFQEAGAARGLVINEFSGNGIWVTSAGVTIEENYLGTNAAGTAAAGNSGSGIRFHHGISSPDPTQPSVLVTNNVISGNEQNGIHFGTTRDIFVQANLIGTNASGTAAVKNNRAGIVLNGTAGNLIGGSGSGEGNLISGNGTAGIEIANSHDNRIEGNTIGLEITGDSPLTNSNGTNIQISTNSNNNIVGGSTPGAGNVIAAGGIGVQISNGAYENTVEGNLIGTNRWGTAARGHWRAGVEMLYASSNTVVDNLIVSNTHGVYLYGESDNNTISGNILGTDAAGTLDLGNKYGVSIWALGSDTPDDNLVENNQIQFSDAEGIRALAGQRNTFLGNTIFMSGGGASGSSDMGIDLGGDGVTPNDPGDADTGPNDLQNFPVLTSVISADGLTTINGSLNSLADHAYRLQFFSNQSQDATGYGEGQVLLGSVDVLTGTSGNATFLANFSTTIPENHSVTATATLLDDHDGDESTPLVPRGTSEFAQNLVVGANSAIGTYDMPFDGTLSVAVYNDDGQIVRTLFEAIPRDAGELNLYWDGRDDFGNVLLGGNYQWRAIAHQAQLVDDGQVGDMSSMPYGVTEHSHSVSAVAVDGSGNVFENSAFEEAHSEIRKWAVDGTALWAFDAGNGGAAVTADDTYVYFAIDDNGENRILRLRSSDGSPANWPVAGGAIVANSAGGHGVFGMAVDTTHLWVSNATTGNVDQYNKTTGAWVTSFSVSDPLGVTTDGTGTVWVVNRGDRVTKFDAAGTVLAEITALNQPYAVSMGGPSGSLFVGEVGTSTVREFDAGTLAEVRSLFRNADPGPVADDALMWQADGRASLAVAADGTMVVADRRNRRVLTYDPSGNLIRKRQSEFQPAPFVDATADENRLISGFFQYQVDYSDGSWEMTHNWTPDDSQWLSQHGVRRTLANGKDYYFFFNPIEARGSVAVYELLPNGMRRAAIVGHGTELWNWADSDGDGVIEESETTYHSTGGEQYDSLAPGMWVDTDGSILIADWNHWSGRGSTTVKVPLQGFDSQGNPLYDWSLRETVIDLDYSYYFDATNLQTNTANGDILLVGTTELNPSFGAFWMGGSAVDIRDADGNRRNLVHISDPVVAIAAGNDPDYFFTGHSGGNQHWVRMYTNDGLMVGEGRIGPGNGSHGGWIDHGMGLSALKHSNGTHYVYAEEVFYGKSIRYRVDDLHTLTRGSGNFSWATAPTYVVTNTNDSGEGSLRQAMLTAAANPGPDEITFDIPGDGIHTIEILSPLPVMDDPVIIDATTESDFAGMPLVQLDGSQADADPNDSVLVDGLLIGGDYSAVKGLTINGFTGTGINVTGRIVDLENNFIGTSADGMSAAPNRRGVWLRSPGLVAGFPENEQAVVLRDNVISGNALEGVRMSSSGKVVVQGNFIGVNVTGTAAVPNQTGLTLDGSAHVQIGGTEAGEGNVISGNSRDGVSIARPQATGNVIEGNRIGTDLTGKVGIPNGWSGIQFGLDAQGNRVGGVLPASANVISGANGTGIGFWNISASAEGNVIEGNFIGTDIDGTTALGNKRGLSFNGASQQVIRNNVIAASFADHHVMLYGNSDGNLFEGNSIGTDNSGTLDFGSQSTGVLFLPDGANTPDSNRFVGNRIAFSGGDGIAVYAGQENSLIGNLIYDNDGLGIDVADDGVNANDSGDTDGVQNTPVLGTIVGGGSQSTINGSLPSAAESHYAIELFSTPTGDPSGHGEGRQLLDAFTVTTDGSGDVAFSRVVPVGLPTGAIITATATRLVDDDGDPQTPLVTRATSEFAMNGAVPANRAPVVANETLTTDEDSNASGNVAANDSDPDNEPLTYSVVTAPTHGVLNLANDGAVTYTPADDFHGTDSFVYEATDGDLAVSGTATIEVAPVNDAPVARDDSAETDEDTPLVVDAQANDVDVDGDALTAAIVVSPSHGSVTVNVDGTLTYSPEQDFFGTDSFVYSLTDPSGEVDTAGVTLTVRPVNDAPVAQDDSATVGGQQSVSVEVAENDSDVDSALDLASIVISQVPQYGTAALVNGNIVYTNTDASSTSDSFSYRIADAEGLLSNEAIVQITIESTDSGSQVSLEDGLLNIKTTEHDDTVVGTIVDDAFRVTIANTLGTSVYTYPVADVNRLKIRLKAGNDSLNIDTVGIIAVVHGGPGNDTIVGGSSNDDLRGGPGNDHLTGGLGADELDGGSGNDVLVGNDGDDHLRGGSGDDEIDGGNGDDFIQSGAGDDVVDGGDGRDRIRAGSGADQVNAGTGDDLVWSGAGDDIVHGGPGDDRLDSGRGDDVVFGELGNDLILSGSGADILVGGDGCDWLDAGSGRDILIGGRHSDLLQGRGGDDILIAGYTTYDADIAALQQIGLEWWSNRSYQQRVDNLSGNGGGPRENGSVFLQTGSGGTVMNDEVVDLVFGQRGRDWFFVNDQDIDDRRLNEILDNDLGDLL